MPDRIYLSPHLDDAIFSCGGVIYRQASIGEEVVIVTVFAGDPETSQISPFAQSLHERWGFEGLSIEARREEDLRACERIGAQALHLQIPEAVYRLGMDGVPIYASEEGIFGDLHPDEDTLPDKLVNMLTDKLPEISLGEIPVCIPSGYGGHVDHKLLREAVSKLDLNAFFYRDFPYAMRGEDISQEYQLSAEEVDWIRLSDREIRIWAGAVKEYQSQLSTFWRESDTIEDELKAAHDQMGGIPFLSPLA